MNGVFYSLTIVCLVVSMRLFIEFKEAGGQKLCRWSSPGIQYCTCPTSATSSSPLCGLVLSIHISRVSEHLQLHHNLMYQYQSIHSLRGSLTSPVARNQWHGISPVLLSTQYHDDHLCCVQTTLSRVQEPHQRSAGRYHCWACQRRRHVRVGGFDTGSRGDTVWGWRLPGRAQVSKGLSAGTAEHEVLVRHMASKR